MTRYRMLLASPDAADAGELGTQDLAAAYPWPSTRWVRGLMLMTTDGASTGPDGRSGSISGPQDRAVMEAVRRFSDAIVIGAGTFRSERYRPQCPTPQIRAERVARGQAPTSRVVIVSNSVDLPWSEALFTDSIVPPLLVTAQGAPADLLAAARRHVEVAVLAGAQVEPSALLNHLSAIGLRRIICEGGPQLLGDMIRHGVLDELDLTVSPVLTGGGQIPSAPSAQQLRRLRLVQVMESTGFLFNRYLAERTDGTEGAS